MSDFPRNLQNVAIYLRKSRADMDAEMRGEGETLSKHRLALVKLAEKNRYAIADTYEEVVSGERILDRPEMQRLLQSVHKGAYQAVLCMDLDRLGRGNMVDQGLIQEAFKASGTLIITPRKVYDLQDELDEEWSEFESFMARRELKIITRRLQRGRKQSVAEGKSISRKPTYGYLRDKCLKLYPNPATAPIVQMIFEMAANGYGTARIAKHLTDLGIPTPAGNPIWERSSVYAILKNPVYQGNIVWGRKTSQKHPTIPSHYRRIRQNPENWLITPQAHEPLIDAETHERYVDRLKNTPRVPRRKKLSNPLASLIYCSQCNRAMRRQPAHNRPYNRLLCKTYQCSTKSAAFELVEQRVLQTLRNVLANMVFESKPSNTASNLEARLIVAQKSLEQAEAVIQSLKSQKDNLHDFLEQGIYDVETYLGRSRVLDGRIEDASTAWQTAREEVSRIDEERERLANFLPHMVNVINTYHMTDDIELKNAMLRSIIDKIVFRREPGWTEPDHFDLEILLRI